MHRIIIIEFALTTKVILHPIPLIRQPAIHIVQPPKPLHLIEIPTSIVHATIIIEELAFAVAHTFVLLTLVAGALFVHLFHELDGVGFGEDGIGNTEDGTAACGWGDGDEAVGVAGGGGGGLAVAGVAARGLRDFRGFWWGLLELLGRDCWGSWVCAGVLAKERTFVLFEFLNELLRLPQIILFWLIHNILILLGLQNIYLIRHPMNQTRPIQLRRFHRLHRNTKL